MALDPAEELRLSQILDRLFSVLKNMSTATTDAGKEAFRQTFIDRMKEFRAITARNVIAGVQGPEQE